MARTSSRRRVSRSDVVVMFASCHSQRQIITQHLSREGHYLPQDMIHFPGLTAAWGMLLASSEPAKTVTGRAILYNFCPCFCHCENGRTF